MTIDVAQDRAAPAGLLTRLRARVAYERERRECRLDREFLRREWALDTADLRWRFRTALERLRVGMAKQSVVGPIGTDAALPVITDVNWSLRDPVATLAMPPGLRVVDLQEHAPGVAEALDCPRVCFRPGPGYTAEMVLLRHDPLENPEVPPLPTDGSILIGTLDSGTLLSMFPARMPHAAIQGTTGSGKSVLIYNLLAQLAGRPDIEFWCSDPSGILCRPWPRSARRVSGLADVDAHVELFEAAVAELDRRLLLIPDDADELPTGPDLPTVVLVLEEFPGLMRAADVLKSRTYDPGKMIRACYARLLAEARKVGLRVVTICQRAEAGLLGGFERANMPMRISLRVDSPGSVNLLHPLVTDDVVAAHLVALPGVGLLEAPGVPLVRFRAPMVTYAQYAQRVRSAAA